MKADDQKATRDGQKVTRDGQKATRDGQKVTRDGQKVGPVAHRDAKGHEKAVQDSEKVLWSG